MNGAPAVARRSWHAIGTSVHVLSTEEAGLDAAADAVGHLLDEVDATYSRFRADSELRRLDLRPGHPGRVSPLLAAAIETALRAARLTDGAVDPTVGRAIRLLGYDDDFAALAGRSGRTGRSDPPVVRLEAVPGWQAVRFDPAARTVAVGAGVELDFGSTGKALAADLAAAAGLAAIRDADGTGRGPAGVLVSLGGDIAAAGSAPEGGWRILAAEASETSPNAEGEVVSISGGALATSSTSVRRWSRGGITYHHLLDPATGQPAVTPWRTVSVVAATCLDANAAATATIVKGTAGLGWISAQGLPARLVSQAGDVTRIGGWPGPED